MKHFLKNCAMLGGLLSLCGFVTALVGLAMGGSTRYFSYGPRGWGWGGHYAAASETAPATPATDYAVSEVILQEDSAYAVTEDHHDGYLHRGGHAEVAFSEEQDNLLAGGTSFTSLDIDLGLAEVYITVGEEYSLTVEGNGPVCETYFEDGTLHIKTKNSQSLHNVDLSRLDRQTFILTLPDGTMLDEVELEIGAGSLYADGLRCRTLEAEVGMGELELTNVLCSEKAELTTSMGELTAYDFICEGKTHIEVDMGSFSLTGRLDGRTEIDCGMGSAELWLEHPGSYGYKIKCGMGSAVIDGQGVNNGSASGGDTGSSVYYDVDCGMGSVEIYFE